VATPQHIAQNINGMDRGLVPLDGTVVTAGVDVQQSLLYWVVVGWGSALSPNRFVVVDDALARSEWEQELYGMGVPTDAVAEKLSQWLGSIDYGESA